MSRTYLIVSSVIVLVLHGCSDDAGVDSDASPDAQVTKDGSQLPERSTPDQPTVSVDLRADQQIKEDSSKPIDAPLPSCFDGLKNQDETDVDCGGSCSKKCADTKGCKSAADCQSGICDALSKTCSAAPTCSDSKKNGDETDVDCGGSCSTKCADAKGCKVSADCLSGTCDPSALTCTPAPTCSDSKTNGDEADVDCGGSCPEKCADTKSCKVSADCKSGVCDATALTCTAPDCNDKAKNGDETDVDCGGSCTTKCADTKSCKVNADCQSGTCDPSALTCTSGPSCTDKAKNGDETDVDCGGSCPDKCADSKSCKIEADCQSGICDKAALTCTAPDCNDTVKNGDETDVDCGGSCTTKCADTKACKVGADCAIGICDPATLTCGGPTCTDGVKNGNETDIDCGGSCAGCPAGLVCNADADCLGICDLGVCRFPVTCNDLHQAHPANPSGTYTIDPDGAGSILPFQAYCDMAYAGGGWTLYYSVLSTNASPSQATSVLPGSVSYLPPDVVQLLAQLATQVHIRTTGQAGSRSVTSVAGATPIQNLRSLLVLNNGIYNPADWTGPMTPTTWLWNTCAASGSYPNYTYWACNNHHGLHLNRSSGQSRWDYSGANENMEVYLR